MRVTLERVTQHPAGLPWWAMAWYSSGVVTICRPWDRLFLHTAVTLEQADTLLGSGSVDV